MIGVLALALGFLASVYVAKNLQGKNNSSDPVAQVIVAANDLQVGARIEKRDIKIIQIASSDLPQGAPRAEKDVLGRGVIIPISKGEFILPNRLAGENAGSGLPSLIPPGMRAVSVRVNEVVSVAGFVTPGTRVDVLLTGTPNGSGEQQTTTVLENVAVLASGHTLERTSTGEAQNTAVITLQVIFNSPCAIRSTRSKTRFLPPFHERCIAAESLQRRCMPRLSDTSMSLTSPRRRSQLQPASA